MNHELTATREDITPSIEEVEPQPRPEPKGTWGKWLFNLFTYGGFALVGNEIASLGINQMAKKGGIAHAPYLKFEGWFKKLGQISKKFSPYLTGVGEAEVRAPYLIVSCLGGMTMVPFVKYCEDHKKAFIRRVDRWRYGDRVDTDPAIIDAHSDLDNEHKQSWGSLWKGRIATVFAALAGDYTFGYKDALTTRIFKNSPTYQKYSSLTNIAEVVGEKLPRWLPVSKKIATEGTWLLTLSTTLTALFYLSSRFFAKRRDVRQERKQQHHAAEGLSQPDIAPEIEDQEPATDTKTHSDITRNALGLDEKKPFVQSVYNKTSSQDSAQSLTRAR